MERKRTWKENKGEFLFFFFLSWLVFPRICYYSLYWLEWFGPFCLWFPLPCVVAPKWAEPVEMEVTSNCERRQVPWLLHVPHPRSVGREVKHLWNNHSLGIGIRLPIKDLSPSKIQYNWPAAGPSRRVTLFPLLIQFSSNHGMRGPVSELLSSASCQLDDASSGYYDDAAWNREAGGVWKNSTQMGCRRELAYRLVES